MKSIFDVKNYKKLLTFLPQLEYKAKKYLALVYLYLSYCVICPNTQIRLSVKPPKRLTLFAVIITMYLIK